MVVEQQVVAASYSYWPSSFGQKNFSLSFYSCVSSTVSDVRSNYQESWSSVRQKDQRTNQIPAKTPKHLEKVNSPTRGFCDSVGRSFPKGDENLPCVFSIFLYSWFVIFWEICMDFIFWTKSVSQKKVWRKITMLEFAAILNCQRATGWWVFPKVE